jgi:phage terminase large subunit-like protein
VFAIDCSQKQTPSSSRNVILVIVRLGNDDIVLHEFCKQSDYVELYEAFHILAKKYQPSAVLVEDACNGSALIAQLQHEREFHIVPVVPKGSKTKRLRRHVSHIKRRHIRLPNEAPWYGDFVGEFVSFPDSASDRIDALTMYLDFMESNPVLHAPRRRERASPAGVGSRGPIRLPALSSLMQARGAVLVTASSVQHGPSTMMERPAPISAPNDEITVIMATPDGVIRKKI